MAKSRSSRRISRPRPSKKLYFPMLQVVGVTILLFTKREMEASTRIIEELKGTRKGGKDPMQTSILKLRANLVESETRISALEDDLREAGEAAVEKAEEVSELAARLRALERGEYGLEEAVAECNWLKKVLAAREGQLEEVTQEANRFEYR